MPKRYKNKGGLNTGMDTEQMESLFEGFKSEYPGTTGIRTKRDEINFLNYLSSAKADPNTTAPEIKNATLDQLNGVVDYFKNKTSMEESTSTLNGGKKRRMTRKKHRGGYYSFSGQVGTGAPLWSRHTEVPVVGGKRRRKHTKRHGKRKHRGGSRFGAVAASFQGTGQRGMGNYVATNTKTPPFGGSSQGAFNNAAGSGSTYDNFMTTK
jgi:hypothetical protein